MVSEPSSIDILLHNPEILVVNLNRRWHWLLTLQNCVGLCFQQNINMENIVDSPTHRQFKAIGQIRELVLDFKGAMSLAHKLW